MHTGTIRHPHSAAAGSESAVASDLDPDEFDEIAAHLRSLYRGGAFQTAVSIGEYVAERFFAGSTHRLASAGKAHPSIRRLAKHGNLGFSAATLWTALAVTEQARHLPAGLASALSLEHHRLLVAVRDPEQKALLARAAVDELLGKRALATRIYEAQRDHPRSEKRGRKAGSGRRSAISVVETPAFVVADRLGRAGSLDADASDHEAGPHGPGRLRDAAASPEAVSRQRPKEVLALLVAARESGGPVRARVAAPKPMALATDIASAISAVEDAVQQLIEWTHGTDCFSLTVNELEDFARRGSVCSDRLDDWADDVRSPVDEPA